MVCNTITSGTGASEQDLCAINLRQNVPLVPFIALNFNWPTNRAEVSVAGVTSGHKILADAKIILHPV